MSTSPLEAYIDGASQGNPGPAAMGVVFVDGEGRPVIRLSKYLGETTNNVAEYLALVYALQEAQARGIKSLVVKTDSELMAKQLTGAYHVRDNTLRLFYDLAKSMTMRFEHFVIQHIDRTANRQADRLAAEAIAARFDTSLKTVDSST